MVTKRIGETISAVPLLARVKEAVDDDPTLTLAGKKTRFITSTTFVWAMADAEHPIRITSE